MATLPGTAIFRFKQAFSAKLAGLIPNVVYASPTDAAELMGEDGSGVAVWWSDDASAQIEWGPFTSASEHWLDETANVTLVIQSIGNDTDDTQEVIDERLTNALGQAYGILATDPSCGIDDDTDIQFFAARPFALENPSGALGTRRAGRFELTIEITARLKLAQ